MNPEQNPGTTEHQGEKYLNMLELGFIADHKLTYQEESEDGRIVEKTVDGRDFLEACGSHALEVLVGLEMAKEQDSPDFEIMKGAIRDRIIKRIKPFLETEVPELANNE